MGLSNNQGDKRGGQYPRSSNSPCIAIVLALDAKHSRFEIYLRQSQTSGSEKECCGICFRFPPCTKQSAIELIPNRVSILATSRQVSVTFGGIQEMQTKTEETERKETPTVQNNFSQTTEHRTVQGYRTKTWIVRAQT
jgi:hypothetical protein